jgi:sterol desaturase/sphingolipid hydroxylase (fatty acid hydroxylase superfamily)
MPTPLEILLDPVSLAFIAIYLLLFAWESIFPARKQITMRNWKLKGLFFFAVYFYLSSYLPLLTDTYLVQYQLIDLSGWSTALVVVLGTLLYQLGVYVWHWSMHKSDLLWRVFHQMHHSAERIDMPSAFLFSPMDMIGFIFLGSICFALIMGVSPQATTIILLLNGFTGMFQHANIKTPVWLGYIVQRPESHSIHHERDLHAYNYSDLPLFDILFGTFRNPREFAESAGFFDGASERLSDMLIFRDINKSS